MSKAVKVELNLTGINELMKSPEMMGIINQAAQQIASAAGEGYETEAAHPISFVAIASVFPATREAKRDNRANKTLEKAAGGVRI